MTLKNCIQDLIDLGKIEDPKKRSNIKSNPLLNCKNTPPPPRTNIISSGLPERLMERSIHEIQEYVEEELVREERKFLLI